MFIQHLNTVKYTTMFKQNIIIIDEWRFTMKKNFTPVGNSWAMLFTKTMFEMMEINPENDLAEIEFDKKVLKMKKANIEKQH